jgi:hypothetical protein
LLAPNPVAAGEEISGTGFISHPWGAYDQRVARDRYAGTEVDLG